ncbi:MAG: DUF1320 domain-containing protein [Crocinitomicaceae bacterium]|nr:DUF1320 domain-containing protein [Crocinitomicaceae bacterium]
MTILTLEDLLALIQEDVLDDISENNQANIDKAETSAIGEITGYLSIRYDARRCFNRELIEPDTAVPPAHDGYSGIATVIEKLADITLYNLHTRVMPDNVPKLRQQRYDNAIQWFEKVSDGFIAPELPIKLTTPTTPLRSGNSQASSNTYF